MRMLVSELRMYTVPSFLPTLWRKKKCFHSDTQSFYLFVCCAGPQHQLPFTSLSWESGLGHCLSADLSGAPWTLASQESIQSMRHLRVFVCVAWLQAICGARVDDPVVIFENLFSPQDVQILEATSSGRGYKYPQKHKSTCLAVGPSVHARACCAYMYGAKANCAACDP